MSMVNAVVQVLAYTPTKVLVSHRQGLLSPRDLAEDCAVTPFQLAHTIYDTVGASHFYVGDTISGINESADTFTSLSQLRHKALTPDDTDALWPGDIVVTDMDNVGIFVEWSETSDRSEREAIVVVGDKVGNPYMIRRVDESTIVEFYRIVAA